MVNIILDIMGLLTGTCKTEHRERLFHAVHQITQWGMCSVDSSFMYGDRFALVCL